MKKTMLLLSLLELGCQSNPTPPISWQPDTTLHSNYSFINADGNFIRNDHLLRMYDASHHLGAYAVADSLYDTQTVLSTLYHELLQKDPILCRWLVNGEISALDTTDRTQHRIIPFALVIRNPKPS